MSTRKFIFVDSAASEDIVSNRVLQADDFPEGKLLGHMLTGGPVIPTLSSTTFVVEQEDGLFMLSEKCDHSDLLVIDLEAAPLFSSSSARDALTRFQKLLRFARRRWTKTSPGINERLILSSTKGVVFPYPITSQSSFRITVELAPDQRRREKRARGIEMLAYRIGTDEGGGAREEAPVTNFRKALERLPAAVEKTKALKKASSPASASIDALSVTRLQDGTLKGTIAGCNFDEWQGYLTSSQKDFVTKELTTPHRIEGPAGTGKTLSLVLKCIWNLRTAAVQKKEHRALFVAHSEATRRGIQQMFDPEFGTGGASETLLAPQTVKVTTLQSLCQELLRYDISESEFLDRDAFEAKQAQLLYALEAIEECMASDFSSHRPHLSNSFAAFLEDTDQWVLAEVFQQEIGVMIKGRAGEDLENYKKLPALTYGLPTHSEGDKAFAYLMFRGYQRRLKSSGQFDTDDVVLSALSQLDTPIWRRRREREGYDAIYVDETHLFNINELSIFHRLTRSSDKYPIAYSADISQSLGDRGWSEADFSDAIIGIGKEKESQTVFTSIFRCSPDIVNLAFSITSAGATLFTNFDDPLKAAASAFTEEEERKCSPPMYQTFLTDQQMIQGAFQLADSFAHEMNANRGDIAVIVFGNELFAEVEKFARAGKKPVEVIKHRGDMDVVRRARQGSRFVLSTPDYIGGLEFAGVLLLGVDKGRVPPRLNSTSFDSQNFVSYATHQRLYVAITRAKYRVAILGLKPRGPSEILTGAIAQGILSLSEQ